VPSWFFGAGAALLNEVNQTDRIPGGLITPADRVLTGKDLDSGWTAAVGIRMIRPIARRTRLDLAANITESPFVFSSGSRTRLNQTRTDFVRWFSAATSGLGAVADVSASMESSTASHSALEATASIRFALFEDASRSVYVKTGAGVLAAFSRGGNLTLRGEYRFTTPGNIAAPFGREYHESDTLHVRLEGQRFAPTMCVGAGWTQRFSGKTGLTFEAVMSARHLRRSLFIDAVPATATIADPSLVRSGVLTVIGVPVQLPYVGDPILALVFNNNAETAEMLPSSLSGAPVRGFQTYQGRGWDLHIVPSVSFYFRF